MFNMDISNCDAVRSPQRILSLYFTSILQLMSSQRPDWGVFILKYDFERGANIQSHPEHLELSVYSWDLRMRNELNFYFRKENLTIIITITVANQKETFQPNFPVCSLFCCSNWSNLERREELNWEAQWSKESRYKYKHQMMADSWVRHLSPGVGG